MKNNKELKLDPSEVKQEFRTPHPVIHCCRYWKLSEWEYSNLSAPFWRLYYNRLPGAGISHRRETVRLDASVLVLIPPNTPYSTALKNTRSESIKGRRIESEEALESIGRKGMVDHFFVHFNLGFQFDHVLPRIYVFATDEQLKKELEQLIEQVLNTSHHFGPEQSLLISSFLLSLAMRMPASAWEGKTSDARILKVVDYIDAHYYNSLGNDELAALVAMAPNSFLRLFKTALGTTIQRYLQQVRIEKAIMAMHNTPDSIETIAFQCGFNDRHHFSKVFKKIIGLPPGQYRKEKIYQ
ncbi:helix-turn-helix domain-containing protein [Roseimarinus sediminis]|uniref:helix-turn-helix domain-containing protein n=1 Tax=Roseimarinus sediminis TaxID=1610899 RepID=UPI003D1B647E